MKNRLPLILLPIMVLALVWLFPVSMMRKSTAARNSQAAAAEAERDSVVNRLVVAKKAQTDEAKLNDELKALRDVLPVDAGDILATNIRKISELAANNKVTVSAQGQNDPRSAATPAAGASGDQAANANSAAPKSYTVTLTVSGSLRNVIAFTGAMPSAQRFFLESVQITPDGDGKSVAMDSPVKATVAMKSYVDTAAKATMDPPPTTAGK
ncbi:MAG: hypothetical protein ACOYN3_09465 [Acidimicrobiia bacterium]